eukprot:4361951-Prymnesium_polylepis.1
MELHRAMDNGVPVIKVLGPGVRFRAAFNTTPSTLMQKGVFTSLPLQWVEGRREEILSAKLFAKELGAIEKLSIFERTLRPPPPEDVIAR